MDSFVSRTDTSRTFDPDGSVQTDVRCVSENHALVGTFSDGTQAHGFLRTVAGNILKIDHPGAKGATASAIMQGIAGTYFDGKSWHGSLLTH